MTLRGVDHIDLAVSDVERSLAFYLGMLGPLGLAVEGRFQTYRETEEVVYLGFGQKFVPGAVPETRLGLRKADGGHHEYYGVGIEHLAFTAESVEEVDDAYQRCLDMGARIHCPPEDEPDLPGYYAFFVFDPDGFRIEVCFTSDEVRRQWEAGEHLAGGPHRPAAA
jgi:catechol 2,3-dioxygenase-like lactoylglutathione lyase family enzyme